MLAVARVAGELDLVALEHAANLLVLELTRQRSVADTEQRLRVDLADELLAGHHLEGILDRFRAMGYDLDRQPPARGPRSWA